MINPKRADSDSTDSARSLESGKWMFLKLLGGARLPNIGADAQMFHCRFMELMQIFIGNLYKSNHPIGQDIISGHLKLCLIIQLPRISGNWSHSSRCGTQEKALLKRNPRAVGG